MQGSGVDSSLNDTGRAQARSFYKTYGQIRFDKIYTSKLRRTVESVQLFMNAGIPQEAHIGLNEISWGNKEGQKITPEEDQYYHWILSQWQQGHTSLRIEGGESPEEVAARQQPVMDHIMSRKDEPTVLICMHGRAMRILLCQLLHYPLRSMDLFEHENLCLYLLNFTGTMFSIEKHNDTRHLKNLGVPDKFLVPGS